MSLVWSLIICGFGYTSWRAALNHLVKSSSSLVTNLSQNNTTLSSFLVLYSFGEQFIQKSFLLWLVFEWQVAITNQWCHSLNSCLGVSLSLPATVILYPWLSRGHEWFTQCTNQQQYLLLLTTQSVSGSYWPICPLTRSLSTPTLLKMTSKQFHTKTLELHWAYIHFGWKAHRGIILRP